MGVRRSTWAEMDVFSSRKVQVIFKVFGGIQKVFRTSSSRNRRRHFHRKTLVLRVVPESLILLLFDQIVPMLASPHWRLLFSSCNTSITTTTTLLRICFVPICFLA